MNTRPTPARRAVIVDHGLGNLFSVLHACEQVGLNAEISADRAKIMASDALILPGVGAFGDAMERLERLDLIAPIRDFASSGKPMMGICLGFQLFFTESHEFGLNRGLDLIPGSVERLDHPMENDRRLKVPQVGWNTIHTPAGAAATALWAGTPLEGQSEGAYFYFVHSYIARPADGSCILTVTRYGGIDFCSSARRNAVFGCQFHPERSGPAGLAMYQRLADSIRPTHPTPGESHGTES